MSALAPAIHSVQFYDTDEELVHRLCGVVRSGLLIGNSVLIVATSAHREQLVKALKRIDVDIRTYAREGRFTMCDAEGMLCRFMVNELPDRKLFLASMGELLLEAKKAACSKDQALVVFGEIVAVLWKDGNKAAALALELLWNELLNERAFHLHCAYPRAAFCEDEAGILNVCESHSHVLGVLNPSMIMAT